MLVDFLRDNKDIFAWKPSDMPGIPREVAEHTLKIHPGSRPVKNAYVASTRRNAGPSVKR